MPSNSPPDQYPSSSHYTRKWDEMVLNINEEEKNEKLEGDAALNKLFQQIYSDGTDEVKRAMNKSFVSIMFKVTHCFWLRVHRPICTLGRTEIKLKTGISFGTTVCSSFVGFLSFLFFVCLRTQVCFFFIVLLISELYRHYLSQRFKKQHSENIIYILDIYASSACFNKPKPGCSLGVS